MPETGYPAGLIRHFLISGSTLEEIYINPALLQESVYNTMVANNWYNPVQDGLLNLINSSLTRINSSEADLNPEDSSNVDLTSPEDNATQLFESDSGISATR